eukprot:3827350-Pyramimonas_sp.AAC.1
MPPPQPWQQPSIARTGGRTTCQWTRTPCTCACTGCAPPSGGCPRLSRALCTSSRPGPRGSRAPPPAASFSPTSSEPWPRARLGDRCPQVVKWALVSGAGRSRAGASKPARARRRKQTRCQRVEH